MKKEIKEKVMKIITNIKSKDMKQREDKDTCPCQVRIRNKAH